MAVECKKITIVGLGYIGLPTAAVMASRGHQVLGVDVNLQTVDTINQGGVHIIEPDLDIIVRSVVTTGNLRASTEIEAADVFMVAVPTPFCGDKVPDLSYIGAAAASIASVLQKGNLVVLESTCPVGTTELLSQWMAEARPDLSFPHERGNDADIRVAHCPERVLPGHVLQELVNNDRIVGGLSERCADGAVDLYQSFVKGECLVTTARTAELSKLTENAFRDVNIAFANELSLVAAELDINVWDLIQLANKHPRVDILQPGPGVGGHCIAVDPWFIVSSAPQTARLIRTAREVNDSKPGYIAELIKRKAERFKQPRIACFGLAFKADIDDLRESPAMDIAHQLIEAKLGDLMLVEPNIAELPAVLSSTSGVALCNTEEALKTADIIVGLVDHSEFRRIDRERLKDKVVIDTRGMWN